MITSNETQSIVCLIILIIIISLNMYSIFCNKLNFWFKKIKYYILPLISYYIIILLKH